MKKENINAAYKSARERYAAVGVDTDKALEKWTKYPCRCTAGRLTM